MTTRVEQAEQAVSMENLVGGRRVVEVAHQPEAEPQPERRHEAAVRGRKVGGVRERPHVGARE